MSNAITGMMAANRRKSGGSGFTPETDTWISRVNALGGTYGTNSKAWANAFSLALAAETYSAEVVYVLGLFGSNFAASRVPIRDSLAVGAATNHSFVDADFSESTGLQGNGSTKYLDSLIKPSQLGTTANGGMGYWELNFVGSGNSEVCGNIAAVSGNRFVLDVRPTRHFFSWGNAGNAANQNTTSTNGNYYGNRSSSTSRKLYLDGSLLDTNTTSDAPADASERNILVVGCDEGGSVVPCPSLLGAFYLTTGLLSDADAAALHTLIDTYIITATGR